TVVVASSIFSSFVDGTFYGNGALTWPSSFLPDGASACTVCPRHRIGRTPHSRSVAPSRRTRDDVRVGAGQRVRTAAGVAAAVVPARGRDGPGVGYRRGAPLDDVLAQLAALRRVHGPRARDLDRVRGRRPDPRSDARVRSRAPARHRA